MRPRIIIVTAILFCVSLLVQPGTGAGEKLPPGLARLEGGLGSGSPYWFVHFAFDGDKTSVRELQVRRKAGAEFPSSKADDDPTIVWRLAAPFAVNPKDHGKDDTYVRAGEKDGKFWVSVQKYGLKAGERYAFRVCVIDAKGKMHDGYTFSGVAIDD